MKRGPFEVIKSKKIYKNPWISVREDQVIRPDGKEGIFGVVEALDGVTILALNSENQVYLVKEYHYAQEREDYEAPSGGMDKGETPLAAAKRELKEEAGLTAKKWTYLGLVDPFTVVFKAPNHLFLAEDLKEGKSEEKEKGLIKLKKFPLGEVLGMIDEGKITHSATVAVALKVARLKGF
jgi:8-oxo-dGTP pyrophosphatase MutT (NUDIX family)